MSVTLRKLTDRDIPGVVTYVAAEYTLDRRRTNPLVDHQGLVTMELLYSNNLLTLARVLGEAIRLEASLPV